MRKQANIISGVGFWIAIGFFLWGLYKKDPLIAMGEWIITVICYLIWCKTKPPAKNQSDFRL